MVMFPLENGVPEPIPGAGVELKTMDGEPDE